MKNTFLILFTFFITAISFSQTSFLVVNEDKIPIGGAHIYYKQKLMGCTNEEGKFSMPNMPLGDTVFFITTQTFVSHVVSENRRKVSQTITLHSPKVSNLTENHYSPLTEEIVKKEIVKGEQIYNDTDEPAEFLGGREEIKKYLKKNLRYPESAFQANVQGKCYLRLVVEKNGEILDFKVTRGVPDCPECDEEAKRVVRNFPKFKPAKLNGAVVRSYYVVPVIFKLD